MLALRVCLGIALLALHAICGLAAPEPAAAEPTVDWVKVSNNYRFYRQVLEGNRETRIPKEHYDGFVAAYERANGAGRYRLLNILNDQPTSKALLVKNLLMRVVGDKRRSFDERWQAMESLQTESDKFSTRALTRVLLDKSEHCGLRVRAMNALLGGNLAFPGVLDAAGRPDALKVPAIRAAFQSVANERILGWDDTSDFARHNRNLVWTAREYLGLSLDQGGGAGIGRAHAGARSAASARPVHQ